MTPTESLTHSPAPTKSEKSDKKNLKIACVGDSITWGFGATKPSDSYPSVLGELLGKKYTVRNFGVDGTTAQKISNLYPVIISLIYWIACLINVLIGHTREGSYWDTHAYIWSMALQPDYVIIMLGTNDSKERNWHHALYQNDLQALAESYLALQPPPEVYLMIPPQIEDTEHVRMYGMQPSVIKNEIPKIINEIASVIKVRVIDLSTLFVDPNQPGHIFARGESGYWSIDGVHPDDVGYEKFARSVYKRLEDSWSRDDFR